jgi:hypothetical protein
MLNYFKDSHFYINIFYVLLSKSPKKITSYFYFNVKLTKVFNSLISKISNDIFLLIIEIV